MIKAILDRIILEYSEENAFTPNGIFIPPAFRERVHKGKIVSVGEGTANYLMSVKQGDTVLYNKYAGAEIQHEGKKYLCMNEFEATCVVNEGEKPRPLHGHVVCKVDFHANEEVDCGGVKLIIATDWDKPQHKTEHGTVYELPDKYAGPLKVGDKVYGNHLTFDEEKIFLKDGENSLVLTPEEEIYLYIRDGKITMMRDKLLCKPVYKHLETVSGIVVTADNEVKNHLRVIALPEDESIIKVDDIVLHSINAAYKFKVEGEECHCLHSYRRQVMCIVETDEYNAAPVNFEAEKGAYVKESGIQMGVQDERFKKKINFDKVWY